MSEGYQGETLRSLDEEWSIIDLLDAHILLDLRDKAIKKASESSGS